MAKKEQLKAIVQYNGGGMGREYSASVGGETQFRREKWVFSEKHRVPERTK